MERVFPPLLLQQLLLLLLCWSAPALLPGCRADESAAAVAPAAAVTDLDDWNWSAGLSDGHTWLVKFYAPWCPACRQLEAAWRLLAERAGEVPGLRVGQVDVEKQQVAGGVFLVTRLPTIYLCTPDGAFRQVGGPKAPPASSDAQLLVSDWLAAARQPAGPPLAWYRSPTAPHMRALGWLIRGALSVKRLHEHLTGPEVGLSVHLSYVIILCLAVTFAACLVLLLVCVCERLCPPEYADADADGDADADADGDGEWSPKPDEIPGEGEGEGALRRRPAAAAAPGDRS